MCVVYMFVCCVCVCVTRDVSNYQIWNAIIRAFKVSSSLLDRGNVIACSLKAASHSYIVHHIEQSSVSKTALPFYTFYM